MSNEFDERALYRAQAITEMWKLVMRANQTVTGSFRLLPSEAAQITGAFFGVEPHVVLLTVGGRTL